MKELQAEVESLSAEVATLNDTLSEEKQNVKDIIKAEIDAAISKIEKGESDERSSNFRAISAFAEVCFPCRDLISPFLELDTLKLEDDALEQRLAALGRTQPKDDLGKLNFQSVKKLNLSNSLFR